MPLDPEIPFVESPNHSSLGEIKIVGTVVHYTAGGSASGSIRWLCNPDAKASSHFVIARDGTTTQLVELDRKAWHAGRSEWTYKTETIGDVGRYTVGVELANHGLLVEDNGAFFYEIGRTLFPYRRANPEYATLAYDSGLEVSGWWEPYPDAQIDALQLLLRKIGIAGYQGAATNLVGHEEIGMPMGRKIDPGPLFPWERFHRRMNHRTWARSPDYA